ncbi:hypothetical protein [Nocardioides mesophilus]|uniref:Uncharacterized protein n=1 Tax=Nocardioides mesophilus TaxID=433659 RepID=A0A7G9RE71_9ACTN|nr:hypothetical protein [Nocardioides mesophilus]QNN53896.1 hypothetical protein H9L09_05770 [Nocardioides mesophilus]
MRSADPSRESPEVAHLRALHRELQDLVDGSVLADGSPVQLRLLGAAPRRSTPG